MRTRQINWNKNDISKETLLILINSEDDGSILIVGVDILKESEEFFVFWASDEENAILGPFTRIFSSKWRSFRSVLSFEEEKLGRKFLLGLQMNSSEFKWINSTTKTWMVRVDVFLDSIRGISHSFTETFSSFLWQIFHSTEGRGLRKFCFPSSDVGWMITWRGSFISYSQWTIFHSPVNKCSMHFKAIICFAQVNMSVFYKKKNKKTKIIKNNKRAVDVPWNKPTRWIAHLKLLCLIFNRSSVELFVGSKLISNHHADLSITGESMTCFHFFPSKRAGKPQK